MSGARSAQLFVMQIRIFERISDIGRDAWNGLCGTGNPFLRYEFLAALEKHDCVGERYGWLPRHITLHRDNQLVGAVPLYFKDNSYGEFVFDWGWADAYQRAGSAYYPKAVISIPYTPATGPRLLVADVSDADSIRRTLLETAIALTDSEGLSSLHCLFTTPQDTQCLREHPLTLRLGCQFHWHNHDYRDFDDFIATFTSRNRKKVKRERRRVREAGIEIRIVHGNEAQDTDWDAAYYFYESTFHRKSGIPTLSKDFFRELGRTMGEQLIMVLAYHEERAVAGAINLRGDDTLYGRHWGCLEEFHSLHFEACYYQGIDYAIQHGLQCFEPGAQGEHKISRGFLPTATWSGHYIRDPRFRSAVEDFCQREQRAMEDYIEQLHEHSPYRSES